MMIVGTPARSARSVRPSRLLGPLAAVALATALAVVPARAQTPNPVYFVTAQDAVTGDNTPQVFTVNGVTCTVSAPCLLPDEVGPGGGAVDSYQADIYERPTSLGQGSQSSFYHGEIDIVQSSVGFDDSFLYYRFTLYSGPLTAKYGFEINFDADNSGDMFVEVDDPADKVPGTWETSHITAYVDTDNSVGGATPGGPDGPGVINGYENKVYNTGNNQFPGNPGGNSAIQARSSGNIVEIAVKRVFLDALNGGIPVEKAAFRPMSSVIPFNEDDYYIHDDSDRRQLGSPYPWLSQPGAPSSCPRDGDAVLTAAEIAALESGVTTPTAYVNPCFPPFQLREFDIGGSAADLAEATFQFNVDLGISKQASFDSVSVGDEVTYTLTVSNVTPGTGNATGVTVIDTIPASLSLVSATPSLGSCTGDPVVTCTIGTMANGDVQTIDIVVRGNTLGTVPNRAWVDVNETDTILANQNDAATVEVFFGTVSILVEGSDTLERLPSNGTSYQISFFVSHTYTAPKDIELFALPVGGSTVLSIDSITGPGVVPGVTPDTATAEARPRATVDTLLVWVNVNDVPLGSADSVLFTAAVAQEPSSDDATSHFRVVRPALTIQKAASAPSDTIPGTEITYTMTVVNWGTAPADSVVVEDALPDELSFKVGSPSETLPSGVGAMREYSDDGGATWAYTPVSGGCGAPVGFDNCVTHVRWSLTTSLSPTASKNSGTVTITTRIR